MRDRILLQGMVFFGHHGALEEERRLGQRFVVDLEIAFDAAPAAASDRLEDTIDYRVIYERLRALFEGGPSILLLERLAEQVARVALLADPRVAAVTARVTKPGVALPGPVAGAAVQVVRERADLAADAG